MRVNPYYITNLTSALSNISAAEQTLTEQLSSGSRVNSLSDDPVASGQNVILLDQINRDDSFTQTATVTKGMLQVTDSTLGSVVSQLNSAITLATEGINGTNNASNLQSISSQLAGIRNEVLALSNTSYLGRFIFSGSQGSTQTFSLDTSTDPASVTYSGDSTTTSIQTPNGQSIQTNVLGSDVFNSSGKSVFEALNTLVSVFSTGASTQDAVSALTELTNSLNYVSQQRVTIDNSINRLEDAQTAITAESTQLTASQNDLMAADPAKIATQLSAAETQQTALSTVIGKIAKGSLFDYL